MWRLLSRFIIRYRVFLLVLLVVLTAFMGYLSSKVQMSYDFTNAIPTDNPKYQAYQQFRETFGEDNNTMMLGVQSKDFFTPKFFNAYKKLGDDIKKVGGVRSVLDVAEAVMVVPDSTKTLDVQKIFPDHVTAENIDSLKHAFQQLEFYKGLLYNPQTDAYVMAIGIDKDRLASKERTEIIKYITDLGDQFGQSQGIDMYYSGLPLIRTQMADKIQFEIRLFLILSFLLTAVIIAIIFKSLTAVITSMVVVAIGVICSFGTLALFGYEITLLTGMIPPLVVVIGIPNCVYFLNKYHTEYALVHRKLPAIRNMIEKMGIVTLFTNLTSAIGFGVFAFTNSMILKEFGIVAGINILVLFFVSLILIPSLYSFLSPPKARHIDYLESKWMDEVLTSLVKLVFRYRQWVYVGTIVICVGSLLGVMRLKSVGHIVDDLPHSDKIYTDLLFFENNFKGVMPLEIIVDTKKKYGALTSLQTWEKLDEFTEYLSEKPIIGGALTLTNAIKMAKQGMMGGSPEAYILPNSFEFNQLKSKLISMMRKRDVNQETELNQLMNSFVDSSLEKVRISVKMADIGSVELPKLLDTIQNKADSIFGTEDYNFTFTGTSITFLEGSKFIIHSLRDSLILAFGMIIVCMFILFYSWRIVTIAVVTNIVPLLMTAGIMGWMGVPLKPSTVLVFSVALGITVDVSIRFLVNFKQDMAARGDDIQRTVLRSIRETGMSIVFTSLILVFGFGVFAISEFQGTKALGYLISLTLFLSMIFNLTLQPAFLLWMYRLEKKKGKKMFKV